MTALVSVIVPTRGGARRLPRLLACLERQDHPAWEVVVVIDEDVDDSASVVESWQGRIPLQVVVFPENRGRAAALNAGRAAARGDVLVRCDDDLTPRPDYLSGHAAAHAEAAAAGSHVGVIGMCRNIYPSTAYARAYGGPAYLRLRADAYAAAPQDRWRYWGGNVSVDRATWDLVGDYDQSYRGYGWEDVDWGYRLWQAGIPLRVVPDLETDHHVAATTTASRAQRAFESGTARRAFEAKHGSSALGALHDSGTQGAWDRLVRAWSGVCTARSIPVLGRTIDASLRILPPPLGEKAVALHVEAAARAGRRRR